MGILKNDIHETDNYFMLHITLLLHVIVNRIELQFVYFSTIAVPLSFLIVAKDKRLLIKDLIQKPFRAFRVNRVMPFSSSGHNNTNPPNPPNTQINPARISPVV